MASPPNKPNYDHGSTGTEPPQARDYANGDPVDANEFDYYLYHLFDKIKGIITHLNDLQDGTEKVDSAANADDSTNVTSTYKGNDIDSDGDGQVNSADSADNATTLQGNAPSDLLLDIEDHGAVLVSDVTAVDIAGDLTVSDDGDGTVTVSTTDTGDTHVDIEDDGTGILNDVSSINCGANIAVSDDGDGSVTISSDNDATTYKGNDIDSDGDGQVDSADQADNALQVDGHNVYVQSTAPSSPNDGDIWVDTS